MEIKYTEEELNSIDKSLLIKMFLNLQNQMETLTVETKALNDKMQKSCYYATHGICLIRHYDGG